MTLLDVPRARFHYETRRRPLLLVILGVGGQETAIAAVVRQPG
ncbi:hypothetical protein [Streptomyces spiralis]